MLSEIVAAVLALLTADVAPQPPDRAAALTTRQLIGQRMIFAYDGIEPPPALRRRIARGEAAGVILFKRNVRSGSQVRATMQSLQAIRRPRGLRDPLIVMVDQEGGPVRRIPGAPVRSAADRDSGEEARVDGLEAARTLRNAGANMNLAPIADVARAGAALVDEGRIEEGPRGLVGEFASAFASGLHAGGVRATAKHYPGFGAATSNTDDAPTRISTSLAQLREVDEPPFFRLVQDGVDAVMVSTAVYPALDDRPAAFSRRWVVGQLRRRVGFRRVVITDDLGTPAVRSFGSLGRRALLAVQAGVDLPLFSSGYDAGEQAADALLVAARDGRMSTRSMRRAAARVLRLRAKLPRD
ncbi:MAG TPA: glycoside hydrolase family 3 N-terminal domain-containing protein [Solirubrobacteraceae bacterium]|nr:glycoside hydrolase family 3 N-terminal domain-containing protein [Solirubrobacteraceae bacterium]